MPLIDKLNEASLHTQLNVPPADGQEPVWKGPQVDGITFSLLSRFIQCPERFRVLTIEGLRPIPAFNHIIEYGQMWHACEEALAAGADWEEGLAEYGDALAKKYPFSREQIMKWYRVCEVQFPMYVDYWSKQPDVTNRTPLYQEQQFDFKYPLPSGRWVRLRGKWDSVDIIEEDGQNRIYLQENKTKGDINPTQLMRQLTFDTQTMIYMTALQFHQQATAQASPTTAQDYVEAPLAGVRYNVIKRPLSGGKGHIVQYKPTKQRPHGESDDEFYQRLGETMMENIGEFFMRWKVMVTPGDIKRFRERFLDPTLERLLDWYLWVTTGDPFEPREIDGSFGHTDVVPNRLNWQHPFGIRNMLDEGGATDLDEYLATGSMVGLERMERLFEELT